jgi:hypothetical protein
MEYEEYEIENELPIFSSKEDLINICEKASIEDLIIYHEACISEKLYDYAKYINRLINKK